MNKNVFFVTGIDTNVGKSCVTGYMAKIWNRQGKRTITQKLVQTGCRRTSADLKLHRRLMGIPWQQEDMEGCTCPQMFAYPSSPHLAAKIEGKTVDLSCITAATEKLSSLYDAVLIEGAGGLMVPLTEDCSTVDYIASQGYPVILVTSGKLGSINHTLLTLELIRSRNLELHTLVYNMYPGRKNERIQNDTYEYLYSYMKKNYPDTALIELPEIFL